MNTQMRAAQRDMLKQEKEIVEKQIKSKHQSRVEGQHKAKLLEIANKGNQRQFPYGTNYSEKKEDVKANNKITYKKITKEVRNN